MPFDPADPSAPPDGGGPGALQVPSPTRMPGRGPSPILQAMTGNTMGQSAGGPGNVADMHSHVAVGLAAIEKAMMAAVDPKDKHQLAQIVSRLSRMSPQQGAPGMGVVMNVLQRIRQALQQRTMAYAGMQNAGGAAQQMPQAGPQGAPPPMPQGPPSPGAMGAFPGA